jgi:hypothetical protein
MSGLTLPPAPPTRLLFRCVVQCDVCGEREIFVAGSAEALDEKITSHNWKRFGPSGSDLCWQCQGASPNTIIVVKR